MRRSVLSIWSIVSGCGLLALTGSGSPALDQRETTLRVRSKGTERVWWRSGAAPDRWTQADPSVVQAIDWHPGASGISWGELELAGSGEAWRTRVVIVRLDPRRVRLRLANGVAPDGGLATWTLGSAPASALLALNAGQFSGGAVWGWVVHEGKEYRPPGRGPLAASVVVLKDGTVRLLDQDETERLRRAGIPGGAEAFQSYPRLLERDGEVPPALRRAGPGIDLAHRDARLALGLLRDGRVLIALTRFDALGPALGGIPFGLNVKELAALLGALGCRSAVALDGGVSAQLLLRAGDGITRTWSGLRAVPLALVGEPGG